MKQKQKAKVDIVKNKYYGFTNKNGDQVVTVCLVLDKNGNYARGVTVFNNNDILDEELGKVGAYQYAIRALKGRRIFREIENGNGIINKVLVKNEFTLDDAVRTLIRTKCPFTLKSELNPELSYYEQQLLFGKNFMKKKLTYWFYK